MTIAEIVLDESLNNIRLAPEIERERAIAVQDLLYRNVFQNGKTDAPCRLCLSLQNRAVRFDLAEKNGGETADFCISLSPFRRLIKDYFLVCESYYKTARRASHAHIEAIDMGRRALHDEAAALLKTKLSERGIKTDLPTARRLFTLICVLHIRIIY